MEIGLGYGSSALAIGEALLTTGTPRPQHVIIDPLQDTEWRDVGWQLLRSAGLDPIVRLIRQPSSMTLPQLVGEKFTADAASVDGSHRFHEVFLDLYFLRKIVRPGGLIIMDDYGWPSVRTGGATTRRWQEAGDRRQAGASGRVRRLRLGDSQPKMPE